MYGKKYMGINRWTFLIDEKGRIKKIFQKVNVEQHADEVLAAFAE
jgi:peroxiredoxin Q/BCP